jgi:hypothetical protein
LRTNLIAKSSLLSVSVAAAIRRFWFWSSLLLLPLLQLLQLLQLLSLLRLLLSLLQSLPLLLRLRL